MPELTSTLEKRGSLAPYASSSCRIAGWGSRPAIRRRLMANGCSRILEGTVRRRRQAGPTLWIKAIRLPNDFRFCRGARPSEQPGTPIPAYRLTVACGMTNSGIQFPRSPCQICLRLPSQAPWRMELRKVLASLFSSFWLDCHSLREVG